MQLQGSAKIELFEGSKKVHEQHDKNMFTNALSRIFAPPKEFACHSDMYSVISSEFMPIATKALGGVLLFDDTIMEDADMVLPPASVNCVGFAGGEYGGSSAYRGNYNTTESGAIANGYRNVWDFATDKANGTIKCLSLTHVNGGNRGWADTAFNSLGCAVSLGAHGGYSAYYSSNSGSGLAILYDTAVDGRTVIGQSQNKLYRQRYLNTNKITLTAAARVQMIPDTKPSETLATLNSSARCYAYDGQIHQIYPTSTTAFKHDIWSFSGTLIQSKAVTVDTAISSNDSHNGCFDGTYYYLYSGSVYARFTVSGAYVEDITGLSGNVVWHVDKKSKRVFANSGMIVGNAYISSSGSNTAPYKAYTDGLAQMPLYVGGSGGANYSNYLCVQENYLATINNLSTPITKTSAQSMKITYEVTQG